MKVASRYQAPHTPITFLVWLLFPNNFSAALLYPIIDHMNWADGEDECNSLEMQLSIWNEEKSNTKNISLESVCQKLEADIMKVGTKIGIPRTVLKYWVIFRRNLAKLLQVKNC